MDFSITKYTTVFVEQLYEPFTKMELFIFCINSFFS